MIKVLEQAIEKVKALSPEQKLSIAGSAGGGYHTPFRRTCNNLRHYLDLMRAIRAAIEAGRYKDVNVIGASIIISVLNAVGEVDLPYTFGGDGAALLVPESVLPDARREGVVLGD